MIVSGGQTGADRAALDWALAPTEQARLAGVVAAVCSLVRAGRAYACIVPPGQIAGALQLKPIPLSRSGRAPSDSSRVRGQC